MSLLTKVKAFFSKVFGIYKDEKTQRVLGLCIFLFGLYLLIAFTSFIFTWENDQDKVTGPINELFQNETKIENWLGKLGALTSHLFMHKWFGAASFFLVPLLFGEGLKKLLLKDMPSLTKLRRRMIFLLVWTSLTLGCIFTFDKLWIGGGFGYVINNQLNNWIGITGTAALLAVSLLIFLVISFNLKFKIPSKKIELDDISEFDNEDDTQENKSKIVPISKAESISNTTLEINEDPVLTKEEEEAMLQFEVKVVESPKNETSKSNENQSNIIEFSGVQNPEIVSNVVFDNPESVLKKEGKVEVLLEEKKEEEVLLKDEDIEEKSKKLVEEFGEFDPTLELGNYQFPTLDLLNEYGKSEVRISQEEFAANNDKIVSTLKNYGIEIEKIKVTPGPTVTLYEIVPAAGVRISKIKNLEDDIALSLSALGIRIIAPIPGKGTIGIEVPNLHPEMVPMKNILASEKFQNSNFDLPVALGKTISNETFIADLAKMPHLLMAGATGQGKSVGLNAVLVSLLYKKHPAQIKFVLVDPKKVELTLFNKIERHFLAKLPNSEEAIITDTTKVVHTLNSLCIEMDNRYELLKDAHVKNIKEYNTKFINRKLNPELGHKYLPYIVVVIDEFADLIMTAGKEVEMPIARIAQLARAIGIHLIIATQRPSVNIITGIIKANFPARIAFRVTSKIDSRTILDTGGADQLIGRGDMLLSTGSDLIRLQCAFVDTPEVEKITEFIGSQRAYPDAHLLPEFIDENADAKEIDLSDRDKMFDDAARIVVQHQQGSASLLQRKLKLGYNRAGRIVDQLEAAGIIGKFEGSKAREVLIKDLNALEQFLNDLNQRD
ncbi:MAG: DNA translocase FtsK 4TM domain-containing protein [Bacteroidota bacterium]